MSKDAKKSFTIRLEFILLIIELLKLQNIISIHWTTILLIIFVPMIIGRIIVFYAKRIHKQIKDLPSGNHKVGIFRVSVKGNKNGK